jgi:dTDP-4-amino-4,6-dideoxygalactose transaminase
MTASMIPFLDLKPVYDELKSELDEAVARVVRSGWYIGGPEVEAFESDYAAYCGAAHAIGMANGLDALHLALLALGVGAGDEVIVPSNTFIATWLAVSQAGAIPVPVEPIPETGNMDPALVEQAIGPKTKAIMPVHLYGQPVDLDPILAIARRHGIAVIEDAAQAHGAEYKGRRIGAHSDAVCWSFYPGKNLGAMGDAGAVTTDRADVAQRLRTLRNYGSSRKYFHEERGFNSRLDPIQAAVLRVKIGHLDAWNARRRALAAAYLEQLAGTDIGLPAVPDFALPSWHLFVIRHPRRDDLARALEAEGIHTLIHYPLASHQQPAYAPAMPGASFPIAEQLSRDVLSLPMSPHHDRAQVDAVCEAIVRWSRR